MTPKCPCRASERTSLDWDYITYWWAKLHDTFELLNEILAELSDLDYPDIE